MTYWQTLEIAVRELLIEKGITTGAEIAAAIDSMDRRSPADGARLIAKAWIDDRFRRKLLADGSAAMTEFGLNPAGLRLLAVENTPGIHNVIVCTLCSCYPRNLLGLPPDWYKERAYRSRLVRTPRVVLAEFGLELPAETTVRVHDSTADMRYIVIPQRPAGTTDMTEDELAGLVTRDSMIGVSRASSPRGFRE
ncbi:MAG: nitrile hydratase subunit alpha [Paracoccaceae bacterium]|nr:nitrile hydratase subunit alpha [Paracoccaceae bacterium]